jgi:tryptophan 2,3-dioxygenase
MSIHPESQYIQRSSQTAHQELSTVTLPCGHRVLDAKQVHYCDYIQNPLIEELLIPKDQSAQTRAFTHEDEFEFIVVHQSCELSFSACLYELDRAIKAIQVGHLELATKQVDRCRDWILLGARQLAILVDHLSVDDFSYFRTSLAPASGAESIRFRLIEITSGIAPNSNYVQHRGQYFSFKAFLDRGPAEGIGRPKTNWWTHQMEEQSKLPSLATAFLSACGGSGKVFLETLFETQSAYKNLAQALLRYESAILSLRKVHLNAAIKHISESKGTGHTDGVSYLQSVMETARCFPELEGMILS